AVAAGAGGHAGVKSPFSLIQEIRQWFDGPLALSGSIATGGAILAAEAMGADFSYIGSPFIATHEARASEAYKQAIVDCTSKDIWGSGQGIGAIKEVTSAAEFVDKLDKEYFEARDKLVSRSAVRKTRI